jgi:hypothetical protein
MPEPRVILAASLVQALIQAGHSPRDPVPLLTQALAWADILIALAQASPASPTAEETTKP